MLDLMLSSSKKGLGARHAKDSDTAKDASDIVLGGGGGSDPLSGGSGSSRPRPSPLKLDTGLLAPVVEEPGDGDVAEHSLGSGPSPASLSASSDSKLRQRKKQGLKVRTTISPTVGPSTPLGGNAPLESPANASESALGLSLNDCSVDDSCTLNNCNYVEQVATPSLPVAVGPGDVEVASNSLSNTFAAATAAAPVATGASESLNSMTKTTLVGNAAVGGGAVAGGTASPNSEAEEDYSEVDEEIDEIDTDQSDQST